MGTIAYVDRLQSLYANGFENEFLETAVRKIIDHQTARDEADLSRVQGTLAEFEAQYGRSSADFWAAFRTGELEDTADFMEWQVLCQMQERLQNRLNILRYE